MPLVINDTQASNGEEVRTIFTEKPGALTAEEKKYLHPDTCTCWNCVAARKRSGGK